MFDDGSKWVCYLGIYFEKGSHSFRYESGVECHKRYSLFPNKQTKAYPQLFRSEILFTHTARNGNPVNPLLGFDDNCIFTKLCYAFIIEVKMHLIDN